MTCASAFRIWVGVAAHCSGSELCRPSGTRKKFLEFRPGTYVPGLVLALLRYTSCVGTHEVTTHSAEETIELGRKLAAQLAPPKIVLLRGDLGAGKTTMVKGIAEAFEAARQDDVTSPTFTLVHEYRGRKVTVIH